MNERNSNPNTQRPSVGRRRGMTMLELVFASVLLTTLVTAVGLLVRGAYSAWQAHSGDYAQIESANAILRHIVRQVRQATAVTKLTGSGTSNVKMEVTMPSGQTYAWEYKNSNMNFGIGTATDVLAENITNFTAIGYLADGVTSTSTVSQMRAIKCQVQVTLPRTPTVTRTITSWVWLRGW